jgi:PPOX class probable FMN-dependent enzyme
VNYSWRDALSHALRRNRRDAHHRYMQLASLATDGQPANRTVVFRGFSEDDQRLQVATDARSEKVAQLAAVVAVEICWYFTRSREQFRIRGEAVLHAEGPARHRLWSSLSEAARAQFFWPDPGLPLGEGDEATQAGDGPPDSFVLLEIAPFRVDHLQLGADPQQRFLSELRDGRWESQPVNP